MAEFLSPAASNPAVGTPGSPGYRPATSAGTAIAAVVTGSSLTLTADQISAAGGPWTGFRVRVTAFNDQGAAAPVEAHYPQGT
jgi:hypothetical protein